MQCQEYGVITLNVNDLHKPIKRSKIIAKVKREKLHVIFWQETHSDCTEHEKLKKLGFKNIFYSSHRKERKKWVAILILNRVNFQIVSKICDREGH